MFGILVFALIPVVSIVLGGVVGLLKKESGAFNSAVLHFAAGVVFSVVAVELLPDIVKEHSPVEVAIGFTAGKNLGILTVLGLVFFVGAVLGITMLSSLSQERLEMVLSFGLSALLFLVTEELLTEAHEEKETAVQTVCFFAGFLMFLLIGMVA